MFYVKNDKEAKRFIVSDEMMDVNFYGSEDFDEVISEIRMMQKFYLYRFGYDYGITIRLKKNNNI